MKKLTSLLAILLAFTFCLSGCKPASSPSADIETSSTTSEVSSETSSVSSKETSSITSSKATSSMTSSKTSSNTSSKNTSSKNTSPKKTSSNGTGKAKPAPASSKPPVKTPDKTKTVAKPTSSTPTSSEVSSEVSSEETSSAKEVDISTFADEVFRLTNIERTENGLNAVERDYTVEEGANIRAKELKEKFSHVRPGTEGTEHNYATVFDNPDGKYYYMENAAKGQKTPKEVVTSWMNSPGHRANILYESHFGLGVGVYSSGGTIYWSLIYIQNHPAYNPNPTPDPNPNPDPNPTPDPTPTPEPKACEVCVGCTSTGEHVCTGERICDCTCSFCKEKSKCIQHRYCKNREEHFCNDTPGERCNCHCEMCKYSNPIPVEKCTKCPGCTSIYFSNNPCNGARETCECKCEACEPLSP